jgi:tRNA (guanine-N7-)-methyltransferase
VNLPVEDGAGHRREVRSFVLRTGRLTPGQARALEAAWPRYGVEVPDEPVAETFWSERFGRQGPLTLEIGFGMGQSLLAMAAADPERLFIGADVHTPGVGALLAGIEARGLRNVRVVCADAVAALPRLFAPGELDRVQIFFPDPWPKKRHHKRRLIQPAFVAALAERVRPGGALMLATDWVPYAEWMLEVLEASPAWRNQAGAGTFADRPAQRPETRFERRGLDRGHEVRDLVFLRR